jgi:hypothetical protein
MLILEYKIEKSSYVVEIDARKPLAVAYSENSEGFMFSNLV